MHMNDYVLEILTRERLAEMRAEGERSYRVWAARQASRSSRRAFGDVLGRIGRGLRSMVGYSLTTTGDSVRRERPSTHGGLRG